MYRGNESIRFNTNRLKVGKYASLIKSNNNKVKKEFK